MKKIHHFFFVGILCFPLFFIGIKPALDWGDDNAGYIIQARNIAEGQQHSATGYIQNPDYQSYAPASYPAGFPLLLSPIYAIFGINIVAFGIYVTFFLIVFGLLIYKYLSSYFSKLIAALAVLLFVYNPWTLNFKNEIISDLPFSCFFFGSLLLLEFRKINPLSFLLFALLAGFCISIRNIGIVLPVSVILYYGIWLLRGKRDARTSADRVLGIILAASASILIYLLIAKVIFPVNAEGLFSYSYYFEFKFLKENILKNLNYYLGVTRAFFEPWNGEWNFISIITGSLLFTFILLGMIKKIISDFVFSDFVFLMYMGILAVYPYANSGFRFLLPVVPMLLHYAILGLINYRLNLKISFPKLAMVLSLVISFSYLQGWKEIKNEAAVIPVGPHEVVNMEAFSFIRHHTSEDAIIDFAKPRALALFTGRKAFTHQDNLNSGEITSVLLKLHADYILYNSDLSGSSLNAYLEKDNDNLQLIWENDKNRLFKILN